MAYYPIVSAKLSFSPSEAHQIQAAPILLKYSIAKYEFFMLIKSSSIYITI
ncbi:Uncharacterized protein dnm_085680 [Desulfonema magnum]|uniref:Uncharacterized protein n=1 Tax=Desulfonema magnum TaxID=45655 RepID=A0A975GTU3_9BACT|nr:Uncharacterized protein dnm_085680 [Desulfonema magnum]